jgi:hypothetical protein
VHRSGKLSLDNAFVLIDGHTWYVATRKENLSMDEIRQRVPAA